MRSSNYKGYTVFEDGRAIGLKGTVLKPGIASNGYYTIVVCAGGKHTTVCMHRLIAESFIPNPDGKRFVNHINSIRTDNRIENLEWCTPAENSQHAFKAGRCEAVRTSVSALRSRPVVDTISGKTFRSAKDAAAFHNIMANTLVGYLLGNRPNKTTLQYVK